MAYDFPKEVFCVSPMCGPRAGPGGRSLIGPSTSNIYLAVRCHSCWRSRIPDGENKLPMVTNDSASTVILSVCKQRLQVGRCFRCTCHLTCDTYVAFNHDFSCFKSSQRCSSCISWRSCSNKVDTITSPDTTRGLLGKFRSGAARTNLLTPVWVMVCEP